MNEADRYVYANRYDIDRQIDAMRARIVEERRGEIGRRDAHTEAIEVTTAWWSAQYERIENEAEQLFGARY